ncbi:hypothetical protein EVAR_73109_1 [Eumeta japonica]|uniref:Uncharacterized protein n=1 Tax=Eumeta variegata TaxID=151549 RepID=A0A4C1SQD5_EUMVA|nr:hypothetical protein EVAR_73109_1 [Eumeta japonica]
MKEMLRATNENLMQISEDVNSSGEETARLISNPKIRKLEIESEADLVDAIKLSKVQALAEKQNMDEMKCFICGELGYF